ncbi:hypothetical protein PV08_10767 [Exophiala spinifera]|uniref:Protein kinase domain-containing protein n=1 Tax=Exophiala spinifera TaxID=91928 RepID=A0A0D1ZET4_9EURO|nr:uncharacterized protein PV08_10767 [Exophiala spinifera]KIW11467.1 hypothetical protein PV08_10767 [Exophiala spinifera]
MKVQHDNVVHFLAAFQDNGRLYLVYESIHISSQEIHGGPMGPWREFELAAICEQVLSGLLFLKQTLSVCPPMLDTSQVLLNQDGVAKIANVADAIVQGPSLCEHGAHLAHLLFELMEPGTYMADPLTLQLVNPNKWSGRIKDFLGAASKGILSELAEREAVHDRYHYLLYPRWIAGNEGNETADLIAKEAVSLEEQHEIGSLGIDL